MAGKSSLKKGKEVPAWAMPIAVMVGVLVIGLVSWKALTGGTEAIGPPKKTHPGMYNFKEMIDKAKSEGKLDHGIGTTRP